MASSDGPKVSFGNIYLAGQSGEVGALNITRDGFAWKARERNRNIRVQAADVMSLEWVRGGRGQQIRLRVKGGATVRFEGFVETDRRSVADFVMEAFGKELVRGNQAVRGWSWGQMEFQAGAVPSVMFNAGGGSCAKTKAAELEEAFEIPIGSVANVQMSGKNDLIIDFHVDDTAHVKDEELIEMRMYCPDEVDGDELHLKIKARADTSAYAGEAICTFEEIGIAVPRGRYDIDMFPNHIKLHGKSLDFKILYSSITRLFLLPKPNDTLVSFVMSLDPPIRQGSTMYPHIVFNFNASERVEKTLALDEEELQKKYSGKLTKKQSGEVWRVFSKVMKHVSKSPLHVPKNFRTSSDAYAVRTAIGANEGFLFFLESCCFFVNKPPTYIRYDDIDMVEFKRMDLENRFDIAMQVASGQHLLFSNIDRTEFILIFKFLETKQVPIENADVLRQTGGKLGQAVLMDEDGDDSESDDEDFDMDMAKKAEKGGESSKPQSESESDSEDDDFDEKMDDADELKDIIADGEKGSSGPAKKKRKKAGK